MEIRKLNSQKIKELNEWQKKIYHQINLFMGGIELSYFDLDTSGFDISCSKTRCDLFLRIVPKNNSCLEIFLYAKPDEIYISLDGWHENLQYKQNSFDDFVKNIEKFLVFILSESCKLVIFKSNNKPYKWNLYGLENDEWKFYSSTGLLFYNFFGKRNQEEKQFRIFKNAVYPKELFKQE